MKILYVSQYFPPEMGAPAARAAELAQHWSQSGHTVSVLTGFPNHPTGVVPTEWRSRLRRLTYREKAGEVKVFRTWLWPLPNRKSHERSSSGCKKTGVYRPTKSRSWKTASKPKRSLHLSPAHRLKFAS